MLHAVRILFFLLCGVVGWWIGDYWKSPARGIGIGLALSMAVILLELSFARRFIGILSIIMFGILIGFVVSHFIIAGFYLIPSIDEAVVKDPKYPVLKIHIEFSVTFFCTFLSVIIILHTKDDLKFVVPFVELKREGGTSKPAILDTSVIVDGRIADMMDTHVIDSPIIIPKFVLDELQKIADSQDRTKRNRGRRGLDVLNRLRKAKNVDVQVQDIPLPGVEGVDAKLVRLAKIIDARVVTTDFNLNKVAQVQGVEVININDIATALRPIVLQGEKLTVRVQRLGESAGQGVGYMEDGTMVVGEDCAGRVGQEVELVVTNILQTSAGRLIFGRPSSQA
jgi:uncharacterized protein YacL